MIITSLLSVRNVIVLFLGIFLMWSGITSATELDLNVTEESLPPGSKIPLTIILDTEESINAFKFEIKYSLTELKLISLNDSDSKVDIWTAKSTEYPGTAYFEGGFIRPTDNQAIEIIKIYFETQDAGFDRSMIRAVNASVYLADGYGTKKDLEEVGAVINMASVGAPLLLVEEKEDKILPTIENILISENPIEKNLKLISFKTRDSISGINNSFIRLRSWFYWGSWLPVSSPMPVSDNVWSFELKVVDNAGNEGFYIGYVWSVVAKKVAGILVFLLFLLLLARMFNKTRKIENNSDL